MAGRIDRPLILRVRMEGQGLATATALGGVLALSIVPRPVGRDPKEPGLELGLALKGVQTFDHGEENLLAEFLDILWREIVAQLKNKARCRHVVPVEQLVPGVFITS